MALPADVGMFIQHVGCHGSMLVLTLIGNEFGEPVIQERQIRIADNPLSFLSPGEVCVSVSVCLCVCVCLCYVCME